MANLRLYKFRFPPSLKSLKGQEIDYSQTANELLNQYESSEHALILCGLSSKDDLLQIVSFYQKKRQVLKDDSSTVVLVDFQEDEKLLKAALRLSFDKVYAGKKYLDDEEIILKSLCEQIIRPTSKPKNHQTYEDLFSSSDTIIVKSKKKELPIEEVTVITAKSPMEAMVESPAVSFRLYEGENMIEATFTDYFDQEVFLSTKVIPESNHLTFEFKSNYQGQKKGLRLKTEVINIEEIEGEYQLTLRLESHQNEFETMLEVYQKREQNIADFMKKVKGI